MNSGPRRPDPDQLLAHVQAEEQSARRGHLKIFLGYAAGVGKTYAMLEAAHQRKREGVDVAIGYIETHKRAETERLVAGLETLPRKSIEYHNVTLTEMDVDAVLSRHPALVLVDELAHTNAPGSRHPKRYLDVEELLNAGIDIYTTLNIQHLESLNDVVAQITGVMVRETIPDRVIDEASELELVDLPPDELLSRLREGKVYVPDQAARAIQDFFRQGNLTALREMTMRRAAARVDDQMRSYMETRAIEGPWAAAERLMVCISPNPLGERLIRSARRLADELNAEWMAVYVETPRDSTLPQQKRDMVARSLRLAEELGARSFTLLSPGSMKALVETIVDFAHKNNVTKIVAGKPLRPAWYERLRGSLVSNLIHMSGDLDIYVIPTAEPAHLPPEENPLQIHSHLPGYIGSLLLVAIATSLSYFFGQHISPTNLVMIYLLAVVIAAIYLGRGPAILASLLGVLAFDYFFVPPKYNFRVTDTEYILTFIGLFLVGIVISALTVQAREQAESAQRREADTSVLYALSRDLAAADGLRAVINAIRTHIASDFGRDVIIFLPEGSTTLRPYSENNSAVSDETELSLALWVYQHGEPAGRGTDTLPAASARYVPLKTSQRTIGVLCIKPPEEGQILTPEQRRLLEAIASQAAQAIERVNLADQTRQIKLLQAAEKLQNALLNSISHDLRTPLVSITGALTTLEEQGESLDVNAQHSLVETAREEADRLNRLVGNLLDMTRLEGGALKVKREVCDVEDVIGTAVGQMEERLAGRKVELHVPEEIPAITVDFVLIVHVIHNLLDNALKYSPAGSPLEVQASAHGNEIQIAVLDRGVGIPDEDLERIFDKFYRVQHPQQVTGTGLGLAICKGIVEAHGGRIWAENRVGGGACFTIGLPITEGK
jgi:two-component system sensor histidine kinase KdpD